MNCHTRNCGKTSQIKILQYNKNEIECINNFVLENIVKESDRINLDNLFIENPFLKEMLLILRGFFAYEALFNVFSKRWRVNFGVNLNKNALNLLQAVPYRAKDVPAERAQFAHPDIAIMLTTLNY